jgi:hypothetical protein
MLEFHNYLHGWSIGEVSLDGVFGEHGRKVVHMGTHKIALNHKGGITLQRCGFINVTINGYIIANDSWIELQIGDVITCGSPCIGLRFGDTLIEQAQQTSMIVNYNDHTVVHPDLGQSIRCMICFNVDSNSTRKLSCCSQLICNSCILVIASLTNKCPQCACSLQTCPLDIVSNRIIESIEQCYIVK